MVLLRQRVGKSLACDLSRVVKRYNDEVINLAPSESQAPTNQMSDLSDSDRSMSGSVLTAD